ncbi:MAG: hypothetical protein KC503_32990 [Myxococcales bacterium]|nr:hypothetical protein [Myxococcales bacterium]
MRWVGAAVFLAVLLVPATGTGSGSGTGTGTAAEPKAQRGTGTGTSEGVEDIDVSGAEVKPPPAKPSGLWGFLGRLHPLLVHVPIGWLILLALVDLGGLAIGYETLERAGRPLAIIAALSCLPGLLSGFARADGVAKVSAALLLHRNLMIGCTVLVAAAAALRYLRRLRFTRTMRAVYALLVGLATALLVIGAHHGATMVYGEGYLF